MADLKIKIIGTLDTELSKTELNKKIATLQGQIDKLKLSIQIDDKATKSLSDFSKAMEQQKQITQDLNRVIKEEKIVTKEADGVIREKIKQHLKSGDIIEKEIERINKKNKATQQEYENTKKLTVALDELGKKQKEVSNQTNRGTTTSDKYRNNFVDTTVTTNPKGEVSKINTVNNLDQQRKAIEGLRQQLLKLKETGELSDKSLLKMSNAINAAKSVAEIDKIRNRLNTLDSAVKTRENNKELEKQLELYKRNAQIQATALKNNNHKIISTEQQTSLQNYLNSVKALSTTTPQLQHTMRQLALDFREVSSSAQTASHGQMSMLDAFRTAMVKFPVWMAATTA